MSERGATPQPDAPRETSGPGDAESLSFSEAMGEIEAILRRIEAEKIDIDDLADELRRASRLLDLARAKIRRAETEVTQIVQSLEGEGREDEPDDDEPDPGDGGEEPEGVLF